MIVESTSDDPISGINDFGAAEAISGKISTALPITTEIPMSSVRRASFSAVAPAASTA